MIDKVAILGIMVQKNGVDRPIKGKWGVGSGEWGVGRDCCGHVLRRNMIRLFEMTQHITSNLITVTLITVIIGKYY